MKEIKKRFIAAVINGFRQYGKWLFAAAYLLAVFWCWQHRHALFDLLPIAEHSILLFSLTTLIINVLFFLIALLGFMGTVQLIRTPPLVKLRFQKACKRNSIKNRSNEYPCLRSVYRNRDKPHGLIFKISNMGVTVSTFEENTEQLETALGVKIERIDLGKKSSYTKLYVTPHKYVKPTVISLNNERFSREINCLVVGKTGSGKSYALSLILGIYAKYIQNVSITICDYKKSSFAHFADTPNFYGYEDVPDGIRAFYAEFAERLAANDEERNKQVRVLLIDEYGALIAAQERKIADELRALVANMLFMGRSLGIRVLIGVQRADAEHFKAGARDQFHAILGLGNLSKEQKSMLFNDCKDKMDAHNGVGEGYLLIDGQGIEQVKIAEIQSFAALNDTIRQAMCR